MLSTSGCPVFQKIFAAYLPCTARRAFAVHLCDALYDAASAHGLYCLAWVYRYLGFSYKAAPHVQVLEGFDLVQKLQNLEVDFFSKPKDRLKIADCGVLA